MPIDFISASFAATVACGGIFGFIKAGSVPSLIAGLLFGGALGYGAYLTSYDPQRYGVTLGVSIGLGGFMGYRFINSGKFMPAGLITILSVLMVGRVAVIALTAKTSKTEDHAVDEIDEST